MKPFRIVICLFSFVLLFQACTLENSSYNLQSVTEKVEVTSTSDTMPTNDVSVACSQPKEWEIEFERSGGIAGVQQRITVSSSGQLVKYKENGETDQAQITPEEAEQLASLLAEACPFEASQRLPETCADCFLYELTIVMNNQRYGIQIDDMKLPESGFALLISKLVDLLQ